MLSVCFALVFALWGRIRREIEMRAAPEDIYMYKLARMRDGMMAGTRIFKFV